jgi:predicted nucleotide-binding protein (sugar kinase/HSP70/actin superfamily)
MSAKDCAEVKSEDSSPVRKSANILHYRRPPEGYLAPEERSNATIVFGGLNWRHDFLAKAVFEAAGYRCETLPPPDEEVYELGRRFCSAGQCNPVYFTAGSLLKFLRGLLREGLDRDEICRRYVFFIARSCGPCRFGMYEADYRLALEAAGFADFRVLPFVLNAGIHQDEEKGLRYGIDFGLGVYKAVLLADIFRDLHFQIRPYEVVPGQTDEVFHRCLNRIYAHLRQSGADREGDSKTPVSVSPKPARGGRWWNCFKAIHRHLHGSDFVQVLDECRRDIDSITVDRFRVKPVVKLTGELFAHLTEGPGNYDMFSFLEQEGAQVFPDPIGSMLTHLLYQRRNEGRHRSAMLCGVAPTLKQDLRLRLAHWRKAMPLWFAEKAYVHHYDLFRRRLGGTAHRLPAQADLARLAAPFYHPVLRGGEAHLEVGKSIYYTLLRECHLVLSLKPFGCMPSAQSDGVQVAVQERYPELLFLSLETSGDGLVLAQSRVQMALAEARRAARDEVEAALRRTGRSLDELQRFVESRPEYRRALYPVPRERDFVTPAARFILHVSRRMNGDTRGSNVAGSSEEPSERG